MKLQNDFAFMHRDVTKPIKERKNTYQQFGCECSGGWYQLIHDLCQEITEKYHEKKLPIDLVILQIKEKWGSLRFYYSYPDVPSFFHAFDSMDGTGIRFFSNIDNVDEKEIRHDIAEIVSKYEQLSKTVCEICGQPGELRLDLRRKQTLCVSCYDACIIKMKEMIEIRKKQNNGDK